MHTIFTADAEIVATSFLRPIVGMRIVGAEFSESIGREEGFITIVISHDDFGPVHHRRSDEVQGATTEVEGATIGDGDRTIGEIETFVELSNESQTFGTRHDFQVGIFVDCVGNGTSMVWLHVLNDKVIRCAPFKRYLEIHLPLLSATCIDSVHDANFLIENHITVVAHAFGRAILALEKVEIAIISTNVLDGV